MRTVVSVAILFSLALASCQKELHWDDGSNGDLLVKILQVTPSSNDTNTITFQWDNARHLVEYKSTGKVNGTQTDIINRITRGSDGKIQKLVFKTSATAGFIDSVIYTPTYSGNHLLYVIDTQYTIVGPIRDSIAYTYNPAGFVSAKETHTEIFSVLQPTAKETYAYDTKGNVTERKVYSPNGSGGFDLAATTTFTYDNHNNATFLGDESYITIGAENVSKNFLTTSVTNDVSGGTTYTTTFSMTTFNDYNRPAKSTLKLEPVPPGYEMKLFYSYI